MMRVKRSNLIKKIMCIISILLSIMTTSYLGYRILFLDDTATLWVGLFIIIIITFGLCIKIFSAKNLLKREDIPEELKKEYDDFLIAMIRKKDIDAFILINFIYNIMFWNPMKYSNIIIVWVILMIFVLVYLIRSLLHYNKSCNES